MTTVTTVVLGDGVTWTAGATPSRRDPTRWCGFYRGEGHWWSMDFATEAEAFAWALGYASALGKGTTR